MRLKHHKGTVSLVAAAVILTGVLLWDRGNVSTGEAGKRTENVIEAWRPDDLSKIELTVGERSMRLEREADEEGQLDWVLYEGDRRLDGDAMAMMEVASALELLMFYRKVDDLDRATLGLDAPRATYVVHMGKLGYTLRIGGEAPSPKGGAYVEVEGGARGKVVYVVTAEANKELLIDVNDLLSKKLATLWSTAVERYAIDGPSGTYTLRRGGWGGWTSGAFMLESDVTGKVRANHFQMDMLVTAIGHIEAKRFVPLVKNDPEDSIVIKMEPRRAKDEKVHLVVAPKSVAGCKETEAYAMRREPNPVAACIPASVLEELRIPPEQLRDRRVVATEKTAIIELKLQAGDTVVEVARKDDGWYMRRPTEGMAEKEPTEQLVTAMLRAEGTRIRTPDLAALGLDSPRATVRILALPERTGEEEQSKERVETIEIGDEVEGQIHVRRGDDGAVLALSAEVGALFLPQPTLLRSTKIFEEERKYVRGFEVDCGGRRQRVSRGLDLAWAFEEPKEAEIAVDGAFAADLVDGLRGLEAVRWDAEKAQKRHGLIEPWCRVWLKIDEPDPADASGDKRIVRQLGVSLGAETQGGYFAKTDEDDAVFVAPRLLGNAADMWLLSRAELIPALQNVETLTLKAGDKTMVVKRQGDSWKASGGSDALAIKVKNILEQLTAEVVDHRGAARDEEGFGEPLLTIELAMRDKPDETLTFTVGKPGSWRNTPVFRIRRSDINVTFLVAKSRIQALLDVL